MELVELGDLIPLYLFAVIVGLTVVCTQTLFFPSFSTIIPALTTYGKNASLKHPRIVKLVAVPKKWFTHFYLLAVVCTGGWLLYATAVAQEMNRGPSESLTRKLARLSRAKPTIPWTSAMLALSLCLVHVVRRCWESLFVSIYSDSLMNVAHYAMGLLHYAILPLAIVCETRGLATREKVSSLVFSWEEVTVWQWVGVAVFVYSNIQQHYVAQQLADMRKGPRGLVTTYAHGVCYGGWFNLVSSPHFFFEIGIYIGLWLALGGGLAFKYLVLFVVVNQTFAALITHEWYKRSFKSYPEHRRAIFPYIL